MDRRVYDALRGTRCVELAVLSPTLVLPVRALSEAERDDAREIAQLVVSLELPGSAVPETVLQVRLDRTFAARAILDPNALRSGIWRPLFKSDEIALTSTDVDRVLVALVNATLRAFPRVSDENDARALRKAVRDAAGRSGDRARASGVAAHEFFDVPSRQLTSWQAFYYEALTS